MEFNVVRSKRRRLIRISYDADGHSFLASPRVRDAGSIALGDLQLYVDEHGDVLYLDGYAPRQSWSVRPLRPPRAIPGRVAIQQSEVPGAGQALALGSRRDWPIFADQDGRVIAIGSLEASPSARAVQVAANMTLVVDGGALAAVWIEIANGRADGH
jgi:hypothetical protein